MAGEVANSTILMPANLAEALGACVSCQISKEAELAKKPAPESINIEFKNRRCDFTKTGICKLAIEAVNQHFVTNEIGSEG